MTTEKKTTTSASNSTVGKPTNKKGLFEKIQAVRVGLQKAEIKKSGKIGGKDDKPYLELADFINPLNELMLEERFTAIVNFTPENATLTAYDFDSDQTHTITSPMREAKVPGCNDMQNLGAIETYQRRYLYMAMFDVAESDIIDGNMKDEEVAEDDADIIEKPTIEQLKQAEELSIDLKKLATYLKIDVSQISKNHLAEAIETKKEALQKIADRKTKKTEEQQ